MRMPLSYCSIACAIQPTVRPTTNSASALPSGSPSARHGRAEREIDVRVLAGQLLRGERRGGDAGAASGPRRGDRVQDSAGARVALGIERMAEPRQILAACEPRRHYRHRLGAVADLAEQRLGARRGAAVPPPGQGTERRRDDRVRGRAGRGNDAGDKSRRVQLVVGQQHENAADQIGARIVETPGSGEPTVRRVTGGFAAGIGIDDRGDEFGQDRAPGPDDPGPPQVERREVLAASVASLT